MQDILSLLALLLLVATPSLLVAQDQKEQRQLPLPTSKLLTVPSPGVLGSLNGFAAGMTVSPDGKYAAILNDGYGAQQNQARQSIAIVNLSTNQLNDFPEDRLPEEAHQSYFVGLAFGSDGHHLYASIGSITDPTGEKNGDTGNGLAVYSFADGKVAWERFIKIPPQRISSGKKVAYDLRKTTEGTVLPYPAGLAVLASESAADKLLVANNLSDTVVLVDSGSGRVSDSSISARSRRFHLRFRTRLSPPAISAVPGAVCGMRRGWQNSIWRRGQSAGGFHCLLQPKDFDRAGFTSDGDAVKSR